MTEPTWDRELRVLERARKGLGPSAAQREATLGRLGAVLALAPAPVPPSSSSSAQAPHAATFGGTKTAAGFSLRALVTGVVSGVLVGFGTGHFVSRHQAEQAAPQISSALAATVIREAPPPPDAGVLRPALVTSGSGALPLARASAAVPASSPGSPRDRIRREPIRQATAESANYDELSYVQRAQTALRNRDAALALGLMRTLDERQPQGALAAERTVLSVLALCQLGRLEEARSLDAAALKNGNVPDVYRRRLDSSCVGRIDQSAGSDGFDGRRHQ